MYDRNPQEIDFGLSYREVRVSEGLSYWESTVSMKLTINQFSKHFRQKLSSQNTRNGIISEH